ncbi:pilus assembly protein CpaE [Arthrobacter sp. Leaf141]|uniref:AAA family ATPase n=1 Tax=unclassified Arthrobacter TaxID=235627 RepID=UPI0006F6E08A|nr:AAA family ATPase [Arthrobacter sp. Leaf141]KQR03141.1 pilus assembly protein CpaE [Arthrobacter sp. Leaf141]
MSRFVVVTAAQDFQRKVQLAVKGALHGSVQVLPPSVILGGPQELFDRLTGEPPEVLVLGPGLPESDSLKLATVFDLQFPEVSLVLVEDTAPDQVILAMRAGIRDIISPSADVDQLRILLERACLASAGRRRGLVSAAGPEREPGRVITVMSPKGGVGKTTVATNLAIGLGRIAPMGVVIVDLDVQFGDVASGLLLEPEHTLREAVGAAAYQDSMVLKAFLTVHPSGIYALCAPNTPSEADHISGQAVSHLLSQMAAEFQYVVVDTTPGLGEHVLAALEQATDAVWVCGMDVPSIRGLHTSFAILRELQLLPQGRHVVLNFADRRSGLTVQDVEATIGVPVDTVIPRSRAVPFTTNKGIPILQENSRDGAAKALAKLVERFDPKHSAAPQKKVHRRMVIS